ncbi:glycosyltransferase family 4 protein [Pseudofrankia asymbiotica]|uniref:Glycosyl transferase n=1 Tax=Pseudofrankia asymbiotica TaxID=1834516 RepID=A0A1V2I1Z3_9ACTN|nr:glycosyltransferase family 4 protein [Pseudofrankia asymbiotica]ONH23657.1 glycosyl transferase [Pseudofrankia asymbiotica]
MADYTVRLAHALRDEVDPVLVTASEVATGPGRGEVSGSADVFSSVVDLRGIGWGPRAVPAAARGLRRAAPDVVHVQFAPSAFGFSPAVGLLPALTGRRVRWLTTLHEYGWWSWPSWPPAWAWRRCERGIGGRRATARWDRETLLLGPRSAGLVVTNPEHAAMVRGRLGVEPHTIPLPPNVAPACERASVAEAPRSAGRASADAQPADRDRRARARADLRRRIGGHPDDPVLVFFGFVHPVKGVRYLLDALAMLAVDHPGLRLVVAGGFTSRALPAPEADAFRRELAGHARAAGVADRVTFTGHLPAAEVSRVLLGADACVLPFTAGVTGRSGALAAALAHGVPTVVTAADPPDPDLADGRTVVVVRGVRDPVPLAAGIRRVIADADLRAAVAAGGRALVAERDWPAVAQAHLRLYQRLVAAEGR